MIVGGMWFPAAFDRDATAVDEARDAHDEAMADAVYVEQEKVCPRPVGGAPCESCQRCRAAHRRVWEEWEETARASQEAAAEARAYAQMDGGW